VSIICTIQKTALFGGMGRRVLSAMNARKPMSQYTKAKASPKPFSAPSPLAGAVKARNPAASIATASSRKGENV
jgi:hypothetical protein